jgi:hypothetical protein
MVIMSPKIFGHRPAPKYTPVGKQASSSGHIFASIIIKLCQDACLGNSSDELEHGSSWMKNKVAGAKNRKTLITL